VHRRRQQGSLHSLGIHRPEVRSILDKLGRELLMRKPHLEIHRIRDHHSSLNSVSEALQKGIKKGIEGRTTACPMTYTTSLPLQLERTPLRRIHYSILWKN
jgi:hypothetical protein